MQESKVNVYVLEPDGHLASLLGLFSTQIALFPFTDAASLLTTFDRNSSATAEIVVLDIALSESDIHTIHALKQRAPNTEVIILTECRDHHAVLKTLREEVPQVLEKPLKEADFLRFFEAQLQRIVVIGSRNFANYEARKNASDTWFFNMKAHYQGLVDALAETGPNPAEIMAIRQPFQEKNAEVKYTVLSIDDEPDIRSGIRLNLRKFYHLLDAESGQVALKILADHPEIDVVLLDVRMPGEWGNVLLPKIKALRPDVEVVMLTAYEETAIAIDTFKKGTYEYLNKPFSKVQIQDCVYRALNVKLTRQYGRTLPLPERIPIFEEYAAIKAALNQTVTYGDLGLFFREILLLDIPSTQIVDFAGRSIADLVCELVQQSTQGNSEALDSSRDMAVALTLAFTQNPTDENRVKMQDALNRLGQHI